MSERLLDIVDPSLPDEQFAEWLDYALDRVELASDEVELVRKWSREAGPKTRYSASNYLFWHGPCSIEDIEAWAMDAEEGVRSLIADVVDICPGSKVLFADKERFARLVSAVAERFPNDFSPIHTLRDFTKKDSEWLELSWREANRLLDIDNADLTSVLIVSYFEHVIVEQNWGPDDPHIRSWVYGNDAKRKQILLEVACWMGLDDGRLREIVQALAKSQDKDISSCAECALKNRKECRIKNDD
jgi:hypothetical protein